jgi:hypothetical protein
VHAKNYYFDWKQRNGNNVTVTNISVYDYFLQKYNVRLEFWNLPLIETTRDGFFPMEVCILNPNQRYQYKLSPDQTASMIKFAVTVSFCPSHSFYLHLKDKAHASIFSVLRNASLPSNMESEC